MRYNIIREVEKNMNEKYVVIETGGSIGENANWGHHRIVGSKVYLTKEKAIEVRKRMTKTYSGSYYDYHYSVKTLDWVLKNNDKIKLEDLTEIA